LDRIDASGGYTRDNTRLVLQAVNFALNSYGEDTFRQIAKAAASFDPEEVLPTRAATNLMADHEVAPEVERDRKQQYIRHIVQEAPHILQERGGRVEKAAMREELRRRYHGELPVDEGNAYGWGFRKLTEKGVIEPTSRSDYYVLRTVRIE
jgi:hypothetical protein